MLPAATYTLWRVYSQKHKEKIGNNQLLTKKQAGGMIVLNTQLIAYMPHDVSGAIEMKRK